MCDVGVLWRNKTVQIKRKHVIPLLFALIDTQPTVVVNSFICFCSLETPICSRTEHIFADCEQMFELITADNCLLQPMTCKLHTVKVVCGKRLLAFYNFKSRNLQSMSAFAVNILKCNILQKVFQQFDTGSLTAGPKQLQHSHHSVIVKIYTVVKTTFKCN